VLTLTLTLTLIFYSTGKTQTEKCGTGKSFSQPISNSVVGGEDESYISVRSNSCGGFFQAIEFRG